MEIKRVYESEHKCEAKLLPQTVDFWKGRGRPGNRGGSDNCKNSAVYLIDGEFFCRKHAGSHVLDKLCQEKTDG